MKSLDHPQSISIRILGDEQALEPPPWVAEHFALEPDGWAESSPRLSVAQNRDAALITVRICDAIRLDSNAFEQATTGAYSTIRQHLNGLHPVRFWNHIPAIHAVMDAERDRYMVFNAGRYRAFESWYGSSDSFSREVATASGVGHRGDDLLVRCLAVRQPGAAVENPRQIASYRYSRRYGPLPPCFARATTIRSPRHGRALLLVGGTASIRGEDSVHPEKLDHQLDETFENLAALATAAAEAMPRDQALSHYHHLRIYFRHEQDMPAIRDAVAQSFASPVRAELIQAELCRQELLVEIEGVAGL